LKLAENEQVDRSERARVVSANRSKPGNLTKLENNIMQKLKAFKCLNDFLIEENIFIKLKQFKFKAKIINKNTLSVD
jgi:hypothetical protein